MKVLAIDTSNLVMGVAILDGERVVGEFITNINKNHSLRLMPAISDLMKEVNIEPSELDKVVVAYGPGSYTGVRIAVTTAKTLAWSLNLPIVGISSLEVLAQNGRYFDGVICPFFDARRGQVYTGLYKSEQEYVRNVQEDRLVLLEDWLYQLKLQKSKVLFIGNDLSIHRETIRDALGEQACFPLVSMQNPRAAELAYLGLTTAPSESVHTFVPKYLQLAEAEAKWLAEQNKVSTDD